MRRLISTTLAVALALALLLPGAGCAPTGENEREITVGNKNFTEQYIIGEMIKQLLEARGFTVTLAADLSTMALREGMEAGDIDICADYTGTAWMVHLGHVYEPGVNNNELYNMVKEEEETNGLTWLDPIWNNNTYVLVSWPEFVEKHNLESLSDLAALYREGAADIKTFVGFEFSTRPDGLPALEEFYDFEVDEAHLMTGAPGASLLGLENHDCDVAMAFGTDAIIAKYDWHVYADDLAFFPPYDLTPYVSQSVLNEYPEIEDILNELVATFPGGEETATPTTVAQCQEAWQELNARVDIDLVEPEDVVHEYLLVNDLIEE